MLEQHDPICKTSKQFLYLKTEFGKAPGGVAEVIFQVVSIEELLDVMSVHKSIFQDAFWHLTRGQQM